MAANSSCHALSLHWKSSNDTGSESEPSQRSQIYTSWINFLYQHYRSCGGIFSWDFVGFNIFFMWFFFCSRTANKLKDIRPQFVPLQSSKSVVPSWGIHYPMYKTKCQFKSLMKTEVSFCFSSIRTEMYLRMKKNQLSVKECNFYGRQQISSKWTSSLSIRRLLIFV